METVASERLEEIFEMHKRAEEALEKEERPRLSEEEYDSRLREDGRWLLCLQRNAV